MRIKSWKKICLPLSLVLFTLSHVQGLPSRQILKEQKKSSNRYDLTTLTKDPVRDKREGFFGLGGFMPNIRGAFGRSIGPLRSTFSSRPSPIYGPSSHVSTLPTPPTIMYGNWKPIYPSDPHYSKPIYKTTSSYVPPNEIRPLATYEEPVQSYQPPVSAPLPLPVSSYEPAPLPVTSYEPVSVQTSYQPVISTYQPTPTVVTSYEPVPVTTYHPEPVPSTYQPVAAYEPPLLELPSYVPQEPVVSSYQPVSETYGSPIASPVSPSQYVPLSGSVSFPDTETSASNIPPPLRLSSPELSPLPHDERVFEENVLGKNLFRTDVEKFRSRPFDNQL